jgi:nucleoside-diphosphate-sugar epimerase
MTPRARRAASRSRAVVTGGAGFIGSHLVDRLLADGHDVLVIDDLSSGTTANLPAGARFEHLDVATADLVCTLRAWRPGVVFHLAAQASVVRSSLDPLRDLVVNVIGTHRVAAAAETSGAARFVLVSSGGGIYGETVRPATERTAPAPASYYGVHKLAAEGHVGLARLPHVILRPSNVYGPRQAGALEGAVVAAFIEQATRDGVIRIHGDGTQTRDFVHVRDVVEALCLVARAANGDGTWNVAAGRSVSVAALADHVERAFGRPMGRSFAPRRPGDVAASMISPAALRRLGWRPKVGLDAGLAELVRDADAEAASRRDPALA